MIIVDKKIVFIDLPDNSFDLVNELIKRGISREEILVIGNNTSDQKSREVVHFDFQSWYVISLIVHENKVAGLIAIDKLNGEVACVRTQIIAMSEVNCVRVFEREALDLQKLVGNRVSLITNAGGSVKFSKEASSQIFSPDDITCNIKVDTKMQVEGVENLFLLPDDKQRQSLETFKDKKEVDSFYDIGCFVDNLRVSLNQEEKRGPGNGGFESMCQKVLGFVRVLPDLEKIRLLQIQLVELMWKTFGAQQDEEQLQKSMHLLDILKDGIERLSIESFSENTNVYELIETLELKDGIEVAMKLVDENVACGYICHAGRSVS